ncbi:MAG: ComEC/Rec2 family competence protein [Saprospiraceae bacterium]
MGQGDCTIIETNVGQADGLIIMIDCGSVSGVDDVYANNLRPTLNDIFADYPHVNGALRNTIDYLFLTHPDGDHYNMLTNERLLLHFNVDEIYYGGPKSAYGVAKDHLPDITMVQNYFNVSARDRIIGTRNSIFKLWILSVNYPFDGRPKPAVLNANYNNFNYTSKSGNSNKNVRQVIDCNGCSLIILIQYGDDFRAMFTGDATDQQQEELWRKTVLTELQQRFDPVAEPIQFVNFQSKLFKMSHHGSVKSCNVLFTNRMVAPEALIVSAGMKNGHPSNIAISQIPTETSVDGSTHPCVLYMDNITEVVNLGKRKTEKRRNYENISLPEFVFTTQLEFISIDEYNNKKKLRVGDKNKYETGEKAYTTGLMMKGRNLTFEVEEDGTYQVQSEDDSRVTWLHNSNEYNG